MATFAIGEAGAKNAGLYAAQMLATHEPELRRRLQDFRQEMGEKALAAELE